MEPVYYELDIASARLAHEANSMREFSEVREVNSYRSEVEEVYALAERQAEKFPEVEERVRYLADKFARKYAAWLNKGYGIESMCPSILVCGAGNFPTKKKERQNSLRDSHTKEYERIMGIKRSIETIGTGGIKSGDSNAIERLEAKAKRLSDKQETMKRANAFYRKNGTLEGFESFGKDKAKKLMLDIERFNLSQPFPSWELSNNSANLRRTRARIDKLKREKETPKSETCRAVNGESCTVVENTDIMRLQIIFDDKPEEETRSQLKTNGFRWSPKNKAWQRQLTDNARRALERLSD